MPQIAEPIKKIIEEIPDTVKAGTVANNVAQNAYRLGMAQGIDENSEQMADFVRDQLAAAPGASNDQQHRGGGGGGGKVKLSVEEREIVKACGIDDRTYAAGKQQLASMRRSYYGA
jgi:hypothetical protein